MDDSLMDKRIIVTGATSGIGLALVEALAQRGAAVIGVGRSPERCARVEEQLIARHPESSITFFVADLSVQGEIRALAQRIRQTLRAGGAGALDGLVNNAGTFAYWQTYTPEGFEMQWAVNHLAPFLLTRELLPLLVAAPAARVVTVSSGSHYRARLPWDDIQLRRRYRPLQAYSQTKLANILFTAELNRRLRPGSTVRAFAADPGLVRTEIGFKTNSPVARWAWALRRLQSKPPETAAEGIVYLLSEPSLQGATDIYWKASRPKAPDPYALNPNAARRLWELSERMCSGVPEEEWDE
jgi:NAD(P)-dependent dehydrogenase (short-subunit alcohol dehydrogenase family)